MTTPTRRNAFNSKSIAESAIAFVIASVLILMIVSIIAVIIRFTFLDQGTISELGDRIFFFSVCGAWLSGCFLLWYRMLIRMRRTPDLDLSEDGFFKFQVASSLFVLALWLLLRGIALDMPGLTSTMRIIFETLLLVFTLVYLSFAWGARKAVPKKIYVGLLINIGVLVIAKFGP
jgi:hypothetical protein